MNDLKHIQDLYVRCHFSELQVTLPKNFPDPQSPGHKAEIYGRRVLICRELIQRFPKSWEKLQIDSSDSRVPKAITPFFSSEYFFDPEFSLPSPEGLGPGYENVSKFFFWAKATLFQAQYAEFNDLLNLEFALHLMAQREEAVDLFYCQFENGIFWRSLLPGRLSILTPNLSLYQFEAKESGLEEKFSREFKSHGLYDLDRLAPPAEFRRTQRALNETMKGK
jgi:hypothetical protein